MFLCVYIPADYNGRINHSIEERADSEGDQCATQRIGHALENRLTAIVGFRGLRRRMHVCTCVCACTCMQSCMRDSTYRTCAGESTGFHLWVLSPA